MWWVATALAAYGCLGLTIALGWYALTLAAGQPPPIAAVQVWAFVVIHVLALLVTFQPWHGLVRWRPLIAVTAGAKAVARVAFIASVMNMLFWMATVLLHGQNATVLELALGVNGMVIVSMVYIAVHWALRPENVLPGPLVRFLSDPVTYLVSRRWSSRESGPSGREHE